MLEKLENLLKLPKSMPIKSTKSLSKLKSIRSEKYAIDSLSNFCEGGLQAEIDPAFAARARFIFESVEKQKPARILDVGCGRGFYLKALSLFPFPRQIHCIDINDAYLQKAKRICNDKRITIKKASIFALPYSDNYFDCIIASEILEHLRDDKKALSEIKRVLKPKGMLLVTVPNWHFPFLWDPLNWTFMRLFNTHIDKNIWWLAGIWADHVRLYKKDELVRLVADSGFQIEKVKQYIRWCWPFSHFLLYTIGKNIVERLHVAQFSRFEFKPKPLSNFLAFLFRLPSSFDSEPLNKTSVTISLKAHKD